MEQRVTPLDPDSPRGRELARDLTLLLDEFEEDVARRRRQRAADDEQTAAPERAA